MNREGTVRITKKDFETFFELMKNSFPEIERRSYRDQKKLFDDESIYNVIGHKNDTNDVIAFIAYWEFKDFNFIEHFAVDENLRGNGLGSELIKQFLNSSGKSTVLEVEIPEDNVSIRRINFYKRAGMSFNDYKYVQPPLQIGNELYPLKIMSYPNCLNEDEFEKIKQQLYSKVYKYKEIYR